MKTFITLFAIFFLSASFGQSYQDDCLDSLEVPSSFTPNGDGMNEWVSIYFPCPPQSFEIKFYNRWGQEVYASENHTFQWDGTSEDKDLPSGTYFWSMKYTFNDKEVNKTGHLSIIR